MKKKGVNDINHLKDLTGQKFGKLTVIKRAENKILPSGRSVVTWKCICDCQNGKNNPEFVYKTLDSLKRNKTPSCGCDTIKKLREAKIKDLTGLRFGRLTVLEQAEDTVDPKGRHYIMWKCICDCQKDSNNPQYTYVRGNHLIDGNTKSCGCLAREMSSIRETIDIVGNKYGMLTVVARGDNTKDGYTRWWCQCDCGSKLKLIRKSNLISGTTISCGCYKPDKIKNNTYNLTGDYGVGYTVKGEEFYFDLEDYDKIKNRYWYITKNGYVASSSCNSLVLFHRLIFDLPTFDFKIEVDHIHHNKNDNRKDKLRIVTKSQNQMNRDIPSNNTSGYKGVNFDKQKNLWIAQIGVNKNKIFLGGFSNKQDAIMARAKAEEIYHGEYSYKNSLKM